jgi:thioredoxin 1
MGADQPLWIDFATSWCPPCRALAPILQEIAAHYAGKLRIRTIDAESSLALARRFDVRAFPTVVALVRGREVARVVGLHRKEKLLALMRLGLPAD